MTILVPYGSESRRSRSRIRSAAGGSRHLGRLRETGLLTSHRSGRMVYHRLDVQRLMHLGVDVLTSIVH